MTRLAWGLFALWVALAVVAAGYATQSEEKFELFLMVALTGFAIVGALVASRRPSNPIGWILLAIVLLNAASSVLIGYTSTADDPVSVAVWMDDWLSDTWIGLIALGIPLLYPDGRLPSPRWRLFAWFAAGCFVLGLLGRMFGDRVLDTEAAGTWHNPYALRGAAGDAAAAIAAASGALYGIAALTGFAAVVVRLRRSRGVERQQVKWFAFVGALMLASLLLAALSLVAPVLGYTIGNVASRAPRRPTSPPAPLRSPPPPAARSSAWPVTWRLKPTANVSSPRSSTRSGASTSSSTTPASTCAARSTSSRCRTSSDRSPSMSMARG